MIINILLITGNPFIQSFFDTDLLGKIIFGCLLGLSVITWVIILYTLMVTGRVKARSAELQTLFQRHRHQPLHLEGAIPPDGTELDPFFQIYRATKERTIELLAKNRQFSKTEKSPTLSRSDMEIVESHLGSVITSQHKILEKNLYILSTITSLSPFLGLLGTVWGILTTFGDPSAQGAGGSQVALAGLSLALTTTVLGLINAIPALIAYNFFKNKINNYRDSMESFANDLLTAVELNYRQVEVS